MLVNLHGKSDTWEAVDLFLEHLNLQLKRQLWARRNGTFDVDKLFNSVALTSDYCHRLHANMEWTFGGKQKSSHTVRSADENIHILAWDLSHGRSPSLKKMPTRRECNFSTPDVLSDGSNALAQGRLDSFNACVTYSLDGSGPAIGEEIISEEITTDAPLDAGVYDVEVCRIRFLSLSCHI
jgi:hypothetical protein